MPANRMSKNQMNHISFLKKNNNQLKEKIQP